MAQGRKQQLLLGASERVIMLEIARAESSMVVERRQQYLWDAWPPMPYFDDSSPRRILEPVIVGSGEIIFYP